MAETTSAKERKLEEEKEKGRREYRKGLRKLPYAKHP